jgi:AraC-like DNA-binding protein
MASERRLTVPVKLLRPLLRELPLHGVAADEALDCPGGRLSASALMRGDLELDRGRFRSRLRHVHPPAGTGDLPAAGEERRKAQGVRAVFDFMVAAGDLREVCERAAQFNAMIEERGYTLALGVDGDVARFVIDFNPSIPRSPPALIVATMLFFHNVFSWATGAPIKLRRIGLAAPRPRRADPCLEILNADVAYGAAENFLAFDAADLARTVVRSADDLAGMVDYIAYDPLFCFRSATPMAGQIRSMLLERAQRGETLPDSLLAADALGISVSTLSRRLRRENTTYLKLKSECQREIAKQLLRRDGLTMPQIAARLGFVDARSFRRAFIGWTGVLPSAFRTSPPQGS